MKNGHQTRDPDRLARLSLHRLGAYAMEEELIEGIEIQEEHVTIVQGDNRFILPPKQASTFLIGMLRGRSWFVEPHDPTEGADDRSPDRLDPSLESTLTSLLDFTRDAGILQGYEKDPGAQTVRIDIPACSTTLSYMDALGYLLDCLQHALRNLRGDE